MVIDVEPFYDRNPRPWRLHSGFLEEVVDAALVLHEDVLPRMLGRDPIITITTEEPGDPLVLLNAQANPGGLPEDAREWFELCEVPD